MQDAAQIRKKDRRDGKTKQQKAAIMEERGMAPAVRCLYALGCQSGKMHSVAQNRRAKSIGGSEEAKKSTLVTYDVLFCVWDKIGYKGLKTAKTNTMFQNQQNGLIFICFEIFRKFLF